MGCDIHCYIDIDLWQRADTGEPYVTQWAHPYVSRDYLLFGVLAGVRWEPWMGEACKAKGLHEVNLSRETFDAFHLLIDDEHPDKRNRCSSDLAERYVKYGALYVERHQRRYVTHPDWHNPSWMTAQELECALERFHAVRTKDFSEPGLYRRMVEAARGIGPEPVIPMVNARNEHIEAILAAMKALDGDEPGRSRLVFWFDN